MSEQAIRSAADVPPRITVDDVQSDPEVMAYYEMGDAYLGAIGYTEHGMRHANLTSHIAGNILRRQLKDREREKPM